MSKKNLSDDEMANVTGAGTPIDLDEARDEASGGGDGPTRTRPPEGGGAHPEVDADADNSSGGGPVDFGV